jgi:glycerate dehydrogenase
MSSPSIVVLDVATLDRGDLDFSQLRQLGNVTFFPDSRPEDLEVRLHDAEIILTNKVEMDVSALSKAPKLRMIAICATGTNNVDLEAAKSRGIRVTNVVGYGISSVAQHALTFILNWATQIHRFAHEHEMWAKSKTFVRLDYPIIELNGKTLGLVGAGKIGNEVGRLASSFGMTVQAWAREGSKPSQVQWPRIPLRQLFETSDVISLHCPLTENTKHLINRETLSWMKPEAFLVNTGRGGLIDENALQEALVSKKISGAGLDVLSVEPPPSNHPLLSLKLPNLMITPHTAWTSIDARKRLLNEVVANIEAFLKGQDRNKVV